MAQQGKTAEAVIQFSKEGEKYPESKTMIQQLLAVIQKTKLGQEVKSESTPVDPYTPGVQQDEQAGGRDSI